MSNDESGTQKAALVTGAGSGIGRATAVRLARAGYRVGLVGRREEPLIETGGMLGVDEDGWALLTADIADAGQAAGVAGLAIERFGRLDVLVNNAGWSPMRPIGEMSAEDVEAVIAVNTVGPMLTTIAALPTLVEADGCVVTVSSMASADPFPGLSVYGGAKAAMNTFTKGLANEYGGEGLRAYAVAPGAVETALLRSIISADDLPREACLMPDDVAGVIAACVAGERGEASGSTIFLSSPSGDGEER